jgi:hypothetical protein
MPEPNITVGYQSGTSEALGAGWDVMHVVYRENGQIINSFVIARDGGGNIIRKTDLVLERWEAVSDEEDLRGFRHCFDERDRLAAEKAANMQKATDDCKCGHPFTAHTRNIHETRALRADDALLPPKQYDITTDRPTGESGCTECDCRQWQSAAHQPSRR